MKRLCELQQAVGRIEVCPEDRCGLWDNGQCSVAGIRPELSTNPALAEHLLSLRRRIEEAEPAPPRAYDLPPGLR
jgi:hypothetical protein